VLTRSLLLRDAHSLSHTVCPCRQAQKGPAESCDFSLARCCSSSRFPISLWSARTHTLTVSGESLSVSLCACGSPGAQTASWRQSKQTARRRTNNQRQQSKVCVCLGDERRPPKRRSVSDARVIHFHAPIRHAPPQTTHSPLCQPGSQLLSAGLAASGGPEQHLGKAALSPESLSLAVCLSVCAPLGEGRPKQPKQPKQLRRPKRSIRRAWRLGSLAARLAGAQSGGLWAEKCGRFRLDCVAWNVRASAHRALVLGRLCRVCRL